MAIYLSTERHRVADLLEQIRSELNARLTELRPLVEEHRRLEAALHALGSVASATANSASSEATRSSTRLPSDKATARKAGPKVRMRAPRGANREAVLRAASDRPGATSAELAAASGVERNTLYALLARLVKDGTLKASKLPTGRSGYAINDAAQADAAN